MPYAPPRAQPLRGSPRQRGYSKQWDRYSLDFRAAFPFCGQRSDGMFHEQHSACAAAGKTVLGTLVDHIHPIRDGGDMWEPTNHQTLCRACHQRKTESE